MSIKIADSVNNPSVPGNPPHKERRSSLLELPTSQEFPGLREDYPSGGNPHRGTLRLPTPLLSAPRNPEVEELGAVCWPPSGFVPLSIVTDRSVAWTIMPDGSRFQPTESTQIRVWKVNIERPAFVQNWTAEREAEVPVKGFAIDCSSFGEPFCTIFWPDFGIAVDGCQLEVELSGLRGDRTKLNFFYEFRNFMQVVLDERLCAEAATLRSLLGDHAFWGKPRIPDEVYLDVGEKGRSKRSSTLASRPDTQPTIHLISYQELVYTTNCVDVTIVIQSDEVAAMHAELNLVRFSGDQVEVPHGAVVQKLPAGNYFFVRAKLPLSRQRFDIRFYTSTPNNPKEFKRHSLRYLITTSKDCQSLLPTFEDPRRKQFGYCDLDPSGQLNGIIVIAPALHRITTGSCYFLVYVDKAVALAAAKAELAHAFHDVTVNASNPDGPGAKTRFSQHLSRISDPLSLVEPQKRVSRLFNERLQLQEVSEANLCTAALAARSSVDKSADQIEDCEKTPPSSPSLVSRRRRTQHVDRFSLQVLSDSPGQAPPPLEPSSPRRCSRSSLSKEHSSNGAKTATTVGCIQSNVRAILEKNTQDTGVEIALDVSLRNGEVNYRLSERADFPGLYEGLFSFSDVDFDKKVQLYYRFPIAHSRDYAPRKLGEWVVVRDEQLPVNF